MKELINRGKRSLKALGNGHVTPMNIELIANFVSDATLALEDIEAQMNATVTSTEVEPVKDKVVTEGTIGKPDKDKVVKAKQSSAGKVK